MTKPTNAFITFALDDIRNNTPHLGLASSDPGVNGTLNEVSGGGYERKAISFGSISFSNGVGQMSNTSEIVFPQLPTGTISHYIIASSLTGSGVKVTGALANSLNITATDELRIPVGSLIVTFGG